MVTTAQSLDDLPDPRREYLLWRYSWRLDYDGVEDLLREGHLGRRCGPWDLPVWPEVLGPLDNTMMGRIRSALVSALGDQCHLCRGRAGLFVDHEHFTGMVRGLLCRTCNMRVDVCPHLAECPSQEYLDDPPAASLRLVYPRWNRLQHWELSQIEHLGFNPFLGPHEAGHASSSRSDRIVNVMPGSIAMGFDR